MKYKCVCGKEFESSQAINSHKANCKTYLESIGKWETRCEKLRNGAIKSNKIHKLNNISKKQAALEKWISEKHVCEHCGKVMTEKFGSGRFCCRACANARKHSEETKHKIAMSSGHVLQVITQHQSAETKYYNNPRKCIKCGKIILYENRHRKTCCDKCKNEFFRETALKHSLDGLTNGGVYSKHGNYDNIHFDSSYELAYYLYCKDHKINIIRNKKFFYYINHKGELHKYYPDFIVDNYYIELKGYKNKDVDTKIKSVVDSGNKIKILYRKDLYDVFKYVTDKYGKNFIDLYQD